jgi:hypothetical protein
LVAETRDDPWAQVRSNRIIDDDVYYAVDYNIGWGTLHDDVPELRERSSVGDHSILKIARGVEREGDHSVFELRSVNEFGALTIAENVV